MSGSFLALVAALLAWAGLAYKLGSLRRSPDDPKVRAFCLSIFFFALALTALIPPLSTDFDRVVGIANLSHLLANCFVLMSVCASLAFHFLHVRVRYGNPRRNIRGVTGGLVVVVVAMIGIFVFVPVHREAADFWQQRKGVSWLLGYRLFYLSYLGLAASILIPSLWHYARIDDRPILTLGLRLSAIGGLFGAGCIVHEGFRAVALGLGQSNPFLNSDTVTRLLILGCLALTLVGSTISAWGSRLGIPTLLGRVDRYRNFRQLYPLWRDLYRAAPQIALLPPHSLAADIATLRDLDFLLHRRVIEIRDGILALRGVLDTWVLERAYELAQDAGLPDPEVQAVVEAAAIAAALQTTQQKRRVYAVAPLPQWGGSDLLSEVAELRRVAWHYRHSPIVRTILMQLERRGAGSVSGVEMPEGSR